MRPKTTTTWLWAGMMAVFCCSIGNGQIIYSNVFNGIAATMNGLAPTVACNQSGRLAMTNHGLAFLARTIYKFPNMAVFHTGGRARLK